MAVWDMISSVSSLLTYGVAEFPCHMFLCWVNTLKLARWLMRWSECSASMRTWVWFPKTYINSQAWQRLPFAWQSQQEELRDRRIFEGCWLSVWLNPWAQVQWETLRQNGELKMERNEGRHFDNNLWPIANAHTWTHRGTCTFTCITHTKEKLNAPLNFCNLGCVSPNAWLKRNKFVLINTN